MSIFRNPFVKEKSSEQMTPDLMVREISSVSEKEAQSNIEAQQEKAREHVEKQAQEKLTAVESDQQTRKMPSTVRAALSVVSQKSINLQKIERVMEENMETIFFKMDDAHRRMFKEEGERTARQIENVIAIGKSMAVKILELLKNWLRLIPGVNKFFLEQEAKIKTDKILRDTDIERANHKS